VFSETPPLMSAHAFWDCGGSESEAGLTVAMGIWR